MVNWSLAVYEEETHLYQRKLLLRDGEKPWRKIYKKQEENYQNSQICNSTSILFVGWTWTPSDSLLINYELHHMHPVANLTIGPDPRKAWMYSLGMYNYNEDKGYTYTF